MKVTLSLTGQPAFSAADLTDHCMKQYSWQAGGNGQHEVIFRGRCVLSGGKASTNIELGARVVRDVNDLMAAIGHLHDFGFKVEWPQGVTP